MAFCIRQRLRHLIYVYRISKAKTGLFCHANVSSCLWAHAAGAGVHGFLRSDAAFWAWPASSPDVAWKSCASSGRSVCRRVCRAQWKALPLVARQGAAKVALAAIVCSSELAAKLKQRFRIKQLLEEKQRRQAEAQQSREKQIMAAEERKEQKHQRLEATRQLQKEQRLKAEERRQEQKEKKLQDKLLRQEQKRMQVQQEQLQQAEEDQHRQTEMEQRLQVGEDRRHLSEQQKLEVGQRVRGTERIQTTEQQRLQQEEILRLQEQQLVGKPRQPPSQNCDVGSRCQPFTLQHIKFALAIWPAIASSTGWFLQFASVTHCGHYAITHVWKYFCAGPGLDDRGVADIGVEA